jgi:hypothetical protein
MGKFDSCRDEALWTISVDYDADETTGEVDYEGYYGLIVLERDEDWTLDLDPSQPREEGQLDTDGLSVTVPAGSYIVTENSQGFVSVYTYDSEKLAREDFKRADDAYSAWLDQDESGV